MKFFRVHLYETYEGSRGYAYATTERDARRIVAKFKEVLKTEAKANEIPAANARKFAGDIESIEVEPTKTGILKALNRYAGHADNG